MRKNWNLKWIAIFLCGLVFEISSTNFIDERYKKPYFSYLSENVESATFSNPTEVGNFVFVFELSYKIEI